MLRLKVLLRLRTNICSKDLSQRHFRTSSVKSESFKEFLENKDQLEQIVKKVFRAQKIEVKNVDHEPIAGYGFWGAVHKVGIDVKFNKQDTAKCHWVCKFSPEDPMLAELLKLTRSQEKEIIFLSDLVPKLNQLTKRFKKPISVPEVVNIVFHKMGDDKPFFIMEDLTRLGRAKTINSIKGLSIEQIKLTTKWLADLHVTSYLLLQDYSGTINRFREEYKDVVTNPLEVVVENGFFLPDVENERDCLVLDIIDDKVNPRGYKDRYMQMVDRHGSVNQMCAHFYQRRHFLEVLVHGNPHAGNIFFNSGNDKPKNVVMIDFGHMHLGNPCVDLAMHFNVCTTRKFRAENLDKCLRLYLGRFNATARECGFNPDLRFDEMKENYKEASVVSLTAAITGQMISSPGVEGGMEEGEMVMLGSYESEEERKEAFARRLDSIPGLKQRITGILDDLIDYGKF